MFAQVADIFPLGRAIDHDIEAIGPAGDHQVVEDPAFLVQQQRITRPMGLERRQIDRQHCLQRRLRPFAADEQLAHVRNIKQPGAFAGPQVLGNDAVILHRHPVAGEFDHPTAARAMPIIKRQHINRRGDRIVIVEFRGFGRVCNIAHAQVPVFKSSTSNRCPLCHGNLRAFPRMKRGYPFGGTCRLAGALSRASLWTRAVLWPERFRGGCSFGARLIVLPSMAGLTESPELSRAISDPHHFSRPASLVKGGN